MRKILILMLLPGLGFLLNTPLNAQSKEAIKFFNSGVSEKTTDRKIENYQKALGISPDFIEAQFALGLLYHQTKQFNLAETYLKKVVNGKRKQSSLEIQDQAYLKLATVQKILNKTTEYEQTLLAGKKEISDKKLLSNITFELARFYLKEGRFNESIVVLNEAKKKFKKNTQYFENLLSIVLTQRETERVERQVDAAIARKAYSEAQSLTQRLRTLNADSETINQKTSLIDSLLSSRAEEELLNDMFLMAEKSFEKGELQKAITAYELVLQKTPANQKVKVKLEKAKAMAKNEELANVLLYEYKTGNAALRDKNWTHAIIAFEKLIKLKPDYRDAAKLLRRANQGFRSESNETIIRQYYIDGVAAMDRKDLNAALASFNKVYSRDKTYKDTGVLIGQIKTSQTETRPSTQKVTDEYFKSLYDQAVTAMTNEDWMQAVLSLEKLRYLDPNDHNILVLLMQAKDKLSLTAESGGRNVAGGDDNNKVVFWFASAVFAVLFIPFMGFVFFSPTNRAKLHHIRGNYLEASRMYELILAKNPEKLRLYATLANIYLVLGKTDDRAIRVYKMLLALNMAPHIHPQINAILSKRYLSQGTVDDGEAIAILENELKEVQQVNKNNNADV